MNKTRTHPTQIQVLAEQNLWFRPSKPMLLRAQTYEIDKPDLCSARTKPKVWMMLAAVPRKKNNAFVRKNSRFSTFRTRFTLKQNVKTSSV